jgi:acetyl-CoA carboxylase carboxyl transferase subunit beta
MGLFSRQKPKIKVQMTKKDGFSGWVKCSHCSDMVHANELHQNLHCCPKCNYHYRLSGTQRVHLLADEDTFKEAVY